MSLLNYVRLNMYY